MLKINTEKEPFQVESAIKAVKTYLLNLQNVICRFAESEDNGAIFHEDAWTHQQGGGGLTRTLAQGKVFEKAGVNFSHVSGKQLPQAATQRNPALAGASFQALGVSVVMHPLNPYVPTTHFNVRFIVVEKDQPYWWFGGGFDMTPYYPILEDCIHWHKTAYEACQPFGEQLYQTYKQWADKYFFLAHRNEARGVGGLFFDDLNEWEFERCFDFMQSVGEHYIKAYQPIVSMRKNIEYGDRERAFQLYRRGRYVEFNLLYDRGTLFGLQSGGRTESILMSLPPLVSWEYGHQVKTGSPEHLLYRDFLQPRDWLGMRIAPK